MANLRSLIGSVSPNDIAPMSKDCTMTIRPSCHCYCNSSYGDTCFLYWCVPQEANCLKVEVWGGGGSGGGSCGCSGGTPGGSGAWSMKCLTKAGGDFAECDVYALYPGPATCCASCCCGIIGCKGYVTGPGLTTFCAEGGNAGQACCFTHWGAFNCMGNNCGYYYTNRMCCDCCRCWYGGDVGSPGRPSATWAQCTCGSCWWKFIFHFPGGLINQTGGFTTGQNNGNACNQEWARCHGNHTGGWVTGPNQGFMPGIGGPSATSCGDGCCYGYPGSAGMVRMTWNERTT